MAVREARLKEIKQEIFNSQKLKSYFEDNPRDRQLLRHDKVNIIIIILYNIIIYMEGTCQGPQSSPPTRCCGAGVILIII